AARGDMDRRGLNQQAALARTGAAQHAHDTAGSPFGEGGRGEFGLRCGYEGMTPRGSDKRPSPPTGSIWQHSSHARPAARASIRTDPVSPDPGRSGLDRAWQALADARDTAPTRVRGPRTGPGRAWTVVVGGAVEHRRQRRRAGRAARR